MTATIKQNYPLPDKEVHSYQVGEELIIFDARSKTMSRLNATASDIWCLHVEKLSPERIAENLSQKYSIEKNEIFPDVVNALESWQAIGILGDGVVPIAEDAESVLAYMKEVDVSALSGKEFKLVRMLKFLDSCFEVLAETEEIVDVLLPLYSHFPAVDDIAGYSIKIFIENDKFVILEGNKEVAKCDEINQISPLVNAHILTTSFYQADCLSVFHAGVIQHDNGVVVLSAGSGSGKSTLTAALMCSGRNFFTDELAILTHDKKVRPAPGCIGLKKGSWEVMEDYYPAIYELQTHYRFDDKIVKYLPPQNFPSNEQLEKGESVKAIVFPKYSPDYKTEIYEISTADALVKLTDAGYHTNQSLNHKTVKDLVDWMNDIPAYELRVNDLNDAVSLVSKLL